LCEEFPLLCNGTSLTPDPPSGIKAKDKLQREHNHQNGTTGGDLLLEGPDLWSFSE